MRQVDYHTTTDLADGEAPTLQPESPLPLGRRGAVSYKIPTTPCVVPGRILATPWAAG